MLAGSELSELRDGIKELVLISQLSRRYDELISRISQVLDITLPLPNVNAYVEARTRFEEVRPCAGADLLLAVLLNCDDNQNTVRALAHCPYDPYFAINGLVLRGNVLDVEYSFFDLWDLVDKHGRAAMYLEDLRFAYIAYGLSRDKRFAQALDELESRGDEVIRKMVSRVRAAVDFVDTVMHTISVDNNGDDNDEDMGVNDEEAQRVFVALRDAMERGKAIVELPLAIRRLPDIVQCTDRREFTLTYGDIEKRVYHWVDDIGFIRRVRVYYDEAVIDFINRTALGRISQEPG